MSEDEKKDALANAKSFFDVAKQTAGGVVKKAADAAKPAADAVVEAAKPAAAAAANAAGKAGKAALDKGQLVAKGAYAAFGGKVDIEVEGNLVDPNGSYLLPEPILNLEESAELPLLLEKYNRLNEPGLIKKAGGAIAKALPDSIKQAAGNVADAITAQRYYEEAMKIISQGFVALEEQAARMSFSEEYVINQINKGKQGEKISKLEELTLLRSYDIAAVVANERMHHLSLAAIEGGGIGLIGFPGIPANIVASLFLYFRAIQSIAMFYGYNTKNDAAEMYIASDVLSAAFGGGEAQNEGAAVGIVGKVMALGELAVVQQGVKKGWAHMAEQGGLQLLIVQMRALANKAAQKALAAAGEKGLEGNIFKNVFAQIGKKLTQDAVGKAVPIVGGVVGALFDSGLMSRVLDYADIFYHKRFIAEKEFRIQALLEHKDYMEVAEEEGIPVEVIEEEVADSFVDDSLENPEPAL